MNAEHVAPASKVLTVVHIPDFASAAVETGPNPTEGATMCGLPMLIADLWVPVDLQEGDVVCPRCQGVNDEQGAMW